MKGKCIEIIVYEFIVNLGAALGIVRNHQSYL